MWRDTIVRGTAVRAATMPALSLTVPEIRHLLAAAFNPPLQSPVRFLHWPN
jgi:hypothetical protein